MPVFDFRRKGVAFTEASESVDVWEDNDENRQRRRAAWKATKAAKAAREIEEKLSLVSSLSLCRCCTLSCTDKSLCHNYADCCVRLAFSWSRMPTTLTIVVVVVADTKRQCSIISWLPFETFWQMKQYLAFHHVGMNFPHQLRFHSWLTDCSHQTTRKKKYAEVQLAKLDGQMKLADAAPGKEQITDEERYMFQRLGLRMRARLLLGERQTVSNC